MDALRSWFLAFLIPVVCQSPLDWPPEPSVPPLPIEQTLIDPDWLARALASGAAVALDARAAELYELGRIPGALRGSELWDSGDASKVASRLAQWGVEPGDTVALYGKDGRVESVAAWYWPLRQAGIKVRVLAGGFAAWRASGKRIETEGAPQGDPVALDVEQVSALLGTAGIALLDVRDARGWERWETPPTFAAGHVPHALPFDLDALLDSDGAPVPLEGVREKIQRHGPRKGDPLPPDSTFIVYGAGADDPRAAVAYLLLDAAGFEARILSGGFTAWTAASQPVVRVVEPAAVRELLAPRGQASVLDLRDEREFALGHLPGAVNVPCYDFEREVTEALAALDPRLPLVLYCYGPECVRSWNAAPLAARRGFRDIRWLRGGTEVWKAAGYPLAESPLPR